MMKARRTRSPFQQEISNPSEHHRRFERMTTTLPSWSRPFLRPVCREEHAVLPHNTEDPLMVGHRLPGFDQLPIGQRGDAAIAIGRPLVDQAADQRKAAPFFWFGIRATRLR